MIDRQCDSIRCGRIAVIVSELGVSSADIDLAVILDNPSVDRIHICARMDIVLLHFQTHVFCGNVRGLVIVHLCQRLRIRKRCAFHEVPSVSSLFDGLQVAENRAVVIAGLQFKCG